MKLIERRIGRRMVAMKFMILFIGWCLLFVLAWPVAILALVLFPLIWLLLLPFRLVGLVFTSVFAFLGAVLMLPARVLGWRPRCQCDRA